MEVQSRIHVIDGLRGFALLGILYVHVLMLFMAGPPPKAILETLVTSPFDEYVGSSIYWIALSKFYSIFSVLFGLSFFIQMRSGQKKSASFRSRFAWRMLLLAGFGLVHWAFFPGDILTMYAIIGLILIPMSYLGNRILFPIAILLVFGFGRAIYFSIYGNEALYVFDGELIYRNWTNSTLDGSLFDVIKASFARYGTFWNDQFTLWGRFYNTLGYFIIGLLLGRSGWLENLDLHLRKFKIIFIASIFGIGVFLTLHIIYLGGSWGLWYHEHNTWFALVRYGIYDLYSISLSLFYASGFILLCSKFQSSKAFGYLSAYGRTGLTSYITQSLIGTFIFFNWGLGLMHHISGSQTLLVFIGIMALQLFLSHVWLQHFKFGPLEWLWRSLTYFEWVPNRKLKDPTQ